MRRASRLTSNTTIAKEKTSASLVSGRVRAKTSGAVEGVSL